MSNPPTGRQVLNIELRSAEENPDVRPKSFFPVACSLGYPGTVYSFVKSMGPDCGLPAGRVRFFQNVPDLGGE